MGISIVLILVLISFIYNIVKKNNIKLNILFCMIPIILTGVSIFFTCYYSNGTSSVSSNINFISCILSLIFAIIGILLLIKDRNTIKTRKSFLLIGMVIAYICIMALTLTKYQIIQTGDYLRTMYITTISIGLLFILQINLFVDLFSNNTNENTDKKE